jgi:thioredoxin-related protein
LAEYLLYIKNYIRHIFGKRINYSVILQDQKSTSENSNKMKRNILVILIIVFSLSAWGQKARVKWYSIQEAEKMIQTAPRPMIVDTYTDWCGWCKKLDADTFSDTVIAEILNTKFYPVKFNAEGKDPVTFQGKTFVNDGKSGNSHQLAIAMLQGKMS